MSNTPAKNPQVLISEEKLEARVAEIGAEITNDYQGREIVAICVLKGSFIFFSDVLRKIDLPIHCEFLSVSSYGDKKVSSGEVKVTLDINEPLENKHVILFEDIVDTGLTLSYLLTNLKARRPASIRTCALLMKPESMRMDVPVDYVGFKIGPEFVVGYGLDDAGKYRGLPYIGYVESEH